VPPIALDESGCAYTLLVNPSGGMVGGDRLAVRVSVGPGAHVLFSTPSANRVYRSSGAIAEQVVELTVAAGGIVEWLPEPTIPFAGSRFHQRLHVTLGAGATVLLWDALASGRMARGERWAFTEFSNDIRVTAGGRGIVERYVLTAHDRAGWVEPLQDWNYVASLYLIQDGMPPDRQAAVQAAVASGLKRRSGRILAGMSEPAAPGLAVKLAAAASSDLTAVLESVWAILRRHLWGVPAPCLRRY
jgi:urease accessory protein